MLPIAQVFGFSIQTGPLAIVLAFVAAVGLTGRLARWRGLDGAAIGDALFYGALAGLAGARAGYVALNWPAYAAEPLSALMPSLTALLPWTGWLAGAGFAAGYLRHRRAGAATLPDVLAPGAVVLAIGLALASFLSGDEVGLPTALPWGVAVGGAVRHPVQLYECLALAAILAGSLWGLRRKTPAWAVALAVLAAYGAARVLVDGFRADLAVIAGVRATQLAALVTSLAALWLLDRRLRPPA